MVMSFKYVVAMRDTNEAQNTAMYELVLCYITNGNRLLGYALDFLRDVYHCGVQYSLGVL
jgi:predicted GTPase